MGEFFQKTLQSSMVYKLNQSIEKDGKLSATFANLVPHSKTKLQSHLKCAHGCKNSQTMLEDQINQI